jgi:hypothetical protein
MGWDDQVEPKTAVSAYAGGRCRQGILCLLPINDACMYICIYYVHILYYYIIQYNIILILYYTILNYIILYVIILYYIMGTWCLWVVVSWYIMPVAYKHDDPPSIITCEVQVLTALSSSLVAALSSVAKDPEPWGSGPSFFFLGGW